MLKWMFTPEQTLEQALLTRNKVEKLFYVRFAWLPTLVEPGGIVWLKNYAEFLDVRLPRNPKKSFGAVKRQFTRKNPPGPCFAVRRALITGKEISKRTLCQKSQVKQLIKGLPNVEAYFVKPHP